MNLKELRLSSKKTQQEVAEYLNISQVTYGRYELGKNEPNIETLKKIADFYNVSLDYLCDRQYNNNVGYIPDEKKNAVQKLIKLENVKFEKAEAYISALLDD